MNDIGGRPRFWDFSKHFNFLSLKVTFGAFIENGVLELLVYKRMPKLSKHLSKMGWTLPSFTQGWYSTVFTSYLQPEVSRCSSASRGGIR